MTGIASELVLGLMTAGTKDLKLWLEACSSIRPWWCLKAGRELA